MLASLPINTGEVVNPGGIAPGEHAGAIPEPKPVESYTGSYKGSTGGGGTSKKTGNTWIWIFAVLALAAVAFGIWYFNFRK